MTTREDVLDVVREIGRETAAEEISNYLANTSPHQISQHLSALQKKGLIVWTNEKTYKPGNYNQKRYRVANPEETPTIKPVRDWLTEAFYGPYLRVEDQCEK